MYLLSPERDKLIQNKLFYVDKHTPVNSIVQHKQKNGVVGANLTCFMYKNQSNQCVAPYTIWNIKLRKPKLYV